MKLRRNQNQLDLTGKQRLVKAIKEMKSRGVYDWYVYWHFQAIGDALPAGAGKPSFVNMGPAFLPWHRYFLHQFEIDLQEADRRLGFDGDLTIPYWDWTQDNEPKANFNPLWNDRFMGPNGDRTDGRVKTGPFATNVPTGNWPLTIREQPGEDGTQLDSKYLERRFGAIVPDLPTLQDISVALQLQLYDCPPWDVRSPGNRSFRN